MHRSLLLTPCALVPLMVISSPLNKTLLEIVTDTLSIPTTHTSRELLGILSNETRQAPPTELIIPPAGPSAEGFCSPTLGIVKPCTSKSTNTITIPTLTPSPSRTSNTTKSLPLRPSSPATPTSTGAADQLRSCFAANGVCEPLFQNTTSLWANLCEDTPAYTQDGTFARLFCEEQTREEREKEWMPACRTCSDVDSRARDAWNAFSETAEAFCTADTPSLYALSVALLSFVRDMVEEPLGIEPAGFSTRVEQLVRAWERLGVNQSTTTGGSVYVPAAGLTQLPRAWPYTRAAVARRPGQTATFTVTSAGVQGVGEYVVVEEVLWNPRPLDSFDVFENFTQSIIGYEDTGTTSALVLSSSLASDTSIVSSRLNSSSTVLSTSSLTTDTEAPGSAPQRISASSTTATTSPSSPGKSPISSITATSA